MDNNTLILNEIFHKESQSVSFGNDRKYDNLRIKFNPFPRSGTTNINGSDFYNGKLVPIDDKVRGQIFDFISHSLQENFVNKNDKFISATITGNYGSGKTQLLMYVKYLLGIVSSNQEFQRNPYVIYVDNPGVKLLEFIGSIISKIGEENFKKFIWDKIIEKIKSEKHYKDILEKFENKGGTLFSDQNPDPYSLENSVSYKKFLDAFVRYLNALRQKKEFEETFKRILIEILERETKDSLIAQYFYELISEDFGVNKTWEALSAGNIKQLDKKESGIIKYIVKLIKDQGYTDFFILVDEFEDITEGRLTKVQVDNYVYNLRTLLDEHREWSLLFAMTGQALKRLRSVSPPLADRISNRLIILQDLTNNQAVEIVKNYLSVARDETNDSINPFIESGIFKLNSLVEGNARKFLKNCYYMVEKLLDIPGSTLIDEQFITTHFSSEVI